MKKQNLINLAVSAGLLLPVLAFAVTSATVDPIPTGTTNMSLEALMGIIVGAMLYIGGGFVVVMFVWAGIKFLLAQGKPEDIQTARLFFLWGVVGVAVMIIGTVIVSVVSSLLSTAS